MTTALRNTGIEPVGEMPWGTHFCHFLGAEGAGARHAAHHHKRADRIVGP